jgi:Flp pilus assembly protein TadB
VTRLPVPASSVRWSAAPAVALGGFLVGSPLVAVVGPIVVTLTLAERGRRRRWRADLARAESLPGAVDHLIQQLQAGSSLAQGCRSLGRDGPADLGRGHHRPVGHGAGGDGVARATAGPLAPLVEALGRGRPLSEAVDAIEGDDDPSVRLVAVTLSVLADNGGPAVPALRRLRHTLVGRAHRRRRARAQASSALASAGLLALAPGMFAAILAVVEPALAHFYLREPLGAACAAVSVLLSAGGWWWIQSTVARSIGWSS